MDNLVLVGFSCSGKTTIGRSLARRLRLKCVDTDRMVEDAAGCPIAEIFRQQGEDAFRAMERAAVLEACRGQGQVISTGGGAFISPENRADLRADNFVIHLQVEPITVVHRLQNSKSGRARPLLDNPNPLERVTELMEARRGAYTLAHVELSVDGRSRYDLVAEISRRWATWRRTHQPTEALQA